MPDNEHPSSYYEQWRRTLDVPARPCSAGKVRAFVCEHASAVGFTDDEVAEIEVAVGEAVTNAILHGHGGGVRETTGAGADRIAIAVGRTGRILFVEVRDAGPGFDPGRVRQAGKEDTDALGGRGLYLMQALMDHVHLHYDGTGMHVRMERSLPFAS